MSQDEEGVLTVIELMKMEFPKNWRLIYAIPFGVAEMLVEAFRDNGLLEELGKDIKDDKICLKVTNAIADHLQLDPSGPPTGQDDQGSSSGPSNEVSGHEFDGITPTTREVADVLSQIREQKKNRREKSKTVNCPANPRMKTQACELRRRGWNLITTAQDHPPGHSSFVRISRWSKPVCDDVIKKDFCDQWVLCLNNHECGSLVGDDIFAPPSFQLLCNFCRAEFPKINRNGATELIKAVFPDWWKKYKASR